MKRFILIILALLILTMPCLAGLEFAGDNDYITFSADPAGKSETRTYSIWFLLAGTPSAEREGLFRGLYTGSRGNWIAMGVMTTGKIRVAMDTTGNAKDFFTTVAFDDGEEHHILVSVSATNFKVYVDGDLDGTVAYTSRTAFNGLSHFRIAYWSDYLEGIAWDARMYDRALSEAEAKNIYYSRGNDKIVDGLVGYWRMDEKPSGTVASSDTIIDYSGEGNDGTTSGGPAWQAVPETLTYPQIN